MSFLSLIAALLVEHFYPLNSRLQIYHLFTRYTNFLELQFNAEQHKHGMIAWILAALPPVIIVTVIYFLLFSISPFLAWAWNAVVLYATMGFKYFSNINAAIAEALKNNDVEQARSQLAKWTGKDAGELSEGEIARLCIEQVFICSHRQIFGAIAWFVVLSPLGPMGAVLYRITSILVRKWGDMSVNDLGEFGKFATRIFDWMDWVPSRLTAISFAIVGDFEDAVYCWRSQAALWMHKTQGILLASGAGALGVKLGDPIHQNGELVFRPELGVGEDADFDYMHSAVSLVWRTLVLWLVVLLLLHLAKLMGN
ncbi:CobD/CbiB family protein [Sulfurirhabdus autotrophica]|uniref:Cobalamin biosynthesis protein CobD n=1 Tax=Sulfurirhabdus autotrophica TaxID=1706046 RepID=A0A4R3YCL2_9PROT|nr:CobD/CbiB family protein [Sulfurirhabdus autotrophica]TCV89552.1 adenosylcobinamide-phosphate synthase [Sulfurirhabdus autotrophica]